MFPRIKYNPSFRRSWQTTTLAGPLLVGLPYKFDVHKLLVSAWFRHLGLLTDVSLGSEIYVGCSNGELLRFALQADDPNKVCISKVALPIEPLHLVPA
jgi:hypothetical protein